MTEEPRKQESKAPEPGKKSGTAKKGKDTSRPRKRKRPAKGRKPGDRAPQKQEEKKPAGAVLGEFISPDVAEELKKRGLFKGTG
jgi:hypothetical protein